MKADLGASMPDGALPVPVERRSAERHLTVLMIGRVDDGRFQQPCLIRNMSTYGLMARFAAVPAVGAHVIVQCRTLAASLAVVRWVQEDEAGLELLRALPVSEALPWVSDRYVPRGPRFGTQLAATMRQGSQARACTLVNISAGGACIEGRIGLTAGMSAELLLPHLPCATPARVAWQERDCFGLCFSAPLTFVQLSRVVLANAAA